MNNQVWNNDEILEPIRPQKEKKKIKLFNILLIFVDIIIIGCFFVAYGPLAFFRNWLVSTALSSMDHDYFAYVLYSKDYVKEIIADNVVIDSGESTDAGKIKISDSKDTGEYESIYEEQILKRDEGNELYKLIPIEGKNWEGNIVVIYDPSRISLALAKNLTKGGQYTSEIAKDNDAKIAINAGGYIRTGVSLRPMGIFIKDGKLVYNSTDTNRIIGFNKDNVLVLGNMSGKEAIAAGIRDSVDFRPFLIINGEVSTFKGNGGYGYRPRTAIGQRKDGIVLMIVVDGKGELLGMSMKELTDIFVRYKAYNAANLDGGGSTCLVVEGEVYNNPTGLTYDGERHVPDAWIVK